MPGSPGEITAERFPAGAGAALGRELLGLDPSSSSGLGVSYAPGKQLWTLFTPATPGEEYQVAAGVRIVLVDCSSNAGTVRLPDLDDGEGTIIHVKKIDSSGNAVTIKGSTTT